MRITLMGYGIEKCNTEEVQGTIVCSSYRMASFPNLQFEIL